jgi:hypothetical protein
MCLTAGLWKGMSTFQGKFLHADPQQASFSAHESSSPWDVLPVARRAACARGGHRQGEPSPFSRSKQTRRAVCSEVEQGSSTGPSHAFGLADSGDILFGTDVGYIYQFDTAEESASRLLRLRHQMPNRRLALDLEPNFHGYLEFFHRAIDDATAFLHHLKPIHVTDGFRSFGNTSLDRFGKAYVGSSYQFDDLVCACHLILFVSEDPV